MKRWILAVVVLAFLVLVATRAGSKDQGSDPLSKLRRMQGTPYAMQGR